MKKFIGALLVVFLSGCSMSNAELNAAEAICKAEGANVKEVSAVYQTVTCSNSKEVFINSENTYNAMMVLSKK